jgi:hypothetical protein
MIAQYMSIYTYMHTYIHTYIHNNATWLHQYIYTVAYIYIRGSVHLYTNICDGILKYVW